MLKDFQSRKFVVAAIAAVGLIVNDVLGKPVTEETIYAALGILGTYILGQGIADHGNQGAAKAAERAIRQGGDVAEAVSGALAGRQSIAPGPVPEVHDDEDDEDGPDWNDTSEMDPEDKPRNLNG